MHSRRESPKAAPARVLSLLQTTLTMPEGAAGEEVDGGQHLPDHCVLYVAQLHGEGGRGRHRVQAAAAGWQGLCHCKGGSSCMQRHAQGHRKEAQAWMCSTAFMYHLLSIMSVLISG